MHDINSWSKSANAFGATSAFRRATQELKRIAIFCEQVVAFPNPLSTSYDADTSFADVFANISSRLIVPEVGASRLYNDIIGTIWVNESEEQVMP